MRYFHARKHGYSRPLRALGKRACLFTMAFCLAISRAPTASTVVVTKGIPTGTEDTRMTKAMTTE